jgi:hypothetical protein
MTGVYQPDETGRLHVHGPIVTLGLLVATIWMPASLRPSWGPPRLDHLVSDCRITSERPPRAA